MHLLLSSLRIVIFLLLAVQFPLGSIAQVWNQVNNPAFEGINQPGFGYCSSSDVLMAVNFDGVCFLSANKGQTWQQKNIGILPVSIPGQLDSYTEFGNVIYISIIHNTTGAPQYYYSTDGGINFEIAQNMPYLNCYLIPMDNQLLLFPNVGGPAFSSTDGIQFHQDTLVQGTNFNWTLFGGKYFWDEDNVDPTKIYVLESQNRQIVDTVDWSSLPFSYPNVTSGSGDSTMYLFEFNGSNHIQNIYRHNLQDSSSQFEQLTLPYSNLISFFVVGNTLFCSTKITGVFHFFRSTNKGQTWDDITNNGLPTAEIYGFNWASEDLLIYHSANLDVFVSTDMGQTFSVRNTGLNGLSYIDLFSMDSLLYARPVKENYNLYCSSDNGLNWNLVDQNLPQQSFLTGTARAYTYKIINKKLFAFELASESRFFVSSNNGLSWDPVSYPNFGDPNYFTTIWSRDDSTFIICSTNLTTQASHYFISEDEGMTWIPNTGLNQIKNDPHFPNNFLLQCVGLNDTLYTTVSRYDFTLSSDDFDSLYVSYDAGYTWNPLPGQPFSDSLIEYNRKNYLSWEMPLMGFKNANEFAVVISSYQYTGGAPSPLGDSLLFYHDGIWEGVQVGGQHFEKFTISSLFFNDSIWYIGTNYGIFETNDFVSWNQRSLSRQMNSSEFQSVNFTGFAKTPDFLFTAVQGGSVFKNEEYTPIPNPVITSELFVFPNPTLGAMTITGNMLQNDVSQTIRIYDLSGRMVKERNVIPTNNQFSLDIHSLATGVYYLKVSNGLGVHTIRFIKY